MAGCCGLTTFYSRVSLIPFVTAYLGQHYTLVRSVIGRHQDHDRAILVRARQSKNWFAVFLYASSVPLAYFSIWVSFGIFVLIPVMYFMPESLSDVDPNAANRH